MKKIIIFVFFALFLNAKEFSVASYNVENLFDLNYDGSEYKEFIPSKNWNEKIYKIKLKHVAQVINDLDADIISLQEIESKRALNDLKKLVPEYKYSSFYKNKKSAIGVALLSKYKIVDTNIVKIRTNKSYARPILENDIKINGNTLKIFTNHWPSKRAKENQRVEYAISLKKRIDKLNQNIDYILLGDFNSDYNEYKTFRYNKKLNNTYNKTGINHVLNSVVDEKFVTKEKIFGFDKKVHYNLWLDLDNQQRFSHKFRKENGTPDNILLSASMFDNKNINYINDSFKVFKPNYLYKRGKINRWKMYKKNHIGDGYSDHLPIYAKFTTKKQALKKQNIQTIADLYNISSIKKPSVLKDIVVIYKYKDSAIIKQKNSRAIYAFSCAKDLELSKSYDLKIEQVEDYLGLKEVTKLKIIKEHKKENILKYIKDANSIDLFDSKNQNEIITNLEGVYKRSSLYFDNKKIKIYFKDKKIKPAKNSKIKILKAHLANYKGKIQIIIYSQNDFKVLN